MSWKPQFIILLHSEDNTEQLIYATEIYLGDIETHHPNVSFDYTDVETNEDYVNWMVGDYKIPPQEKYEKLYPEFLI